MGSACTLEEYEDIFDRVCSVVGLLAECVEKQEIPVWFKDFSPGHEVWQGTPWEFMGNRLSVQFEALRQRQYPDAVALVGVAA